MDIGKGRIHIKVDIDLIDLIPSYLKSLHTTAHELEEKLEHGDMLGCRRLGHNLKGSGGSYGFDFVSQIGAHIEDAAAEGYELDISKHITDLMDYLDRLDIEYQEEAV